MTRSEMLRQRQAMRQRIRATVHARRIAQVTGQFETDQAEETAAAR
ncbi:hypothetical protein Cs7R123_75540 [Catellatospora sp. TT07R-123]|nr:hypothetical protein [Catellatospora sp. TT07R-123]GHJ50212.1 hypothetical protein Cs7R123_75540 [Catellatospora sp. TT07R-123]